MDCEAYQAQHLANKQLKMQMRKSKKLVKKMKKTPEIMAESGIDRIDSKVKDVFDGGHRVNAEASKSSMKRIRGASPHPLTDYDQTIITAGLLVIALGQEACSTLSLSSVDRAPIMGQSSSYYGKQVVAMLTQALSWSDAQYKASEV